MIVYGQAQANNATGFVDAGLQPPGEPGTQLSTAMAGKTGHQQRRQQQA